jgi:hypothetical protein
LREEGRLHFERCDFPAALCGDGVGWRRSPSPTAGSPPPPFEGARLRQVRLERVEVGGHLALDDLVADRVSLAGSRVRGCCRWSRRGSSAISSLPGSRLGTGKRALQADHAVVGRTIRLGSAQDPECRADGAVSLVAARFEALLIEAAIEGPLDLRRSVSEAVVAGRPRVAPRPAPRPRGARGFRDRRRRTGGRTGGRGECLGQRHMRMGGRHSCRDSPAAVDLAGARIAGDLRFSDAFRADGPIRLHGGSIGGNLVFKGQVAVPAGNGLDLRALDCGGWRSAFPASPAASPSAMANVRA